MKTKKSCILSIYGGNIGQDPTQTKKKGKMNVVKFWLKYGISACSSRISKYGFWPNKTGIAAEILLGDCLFCLLNEANSFGKFSQNAP